MEIYDIYEYQMGWDGITLIYWNEARLITQKMKIVEPHEIHSSYMMEFYPLPPMVPDIAHYMLDLKHASGDDRLALSITFMEDEKKDRLKKFAEEFCDAGMRLPVLFLGGVAQKTPGLN